MYYQIGSPSVTLILLLGQLAVPLARLVDNAKRPRIRNTIHFIPVH
jgi:hypothetical protein